MFTYNLEKRCEGEREREREGREGETGLREYVWENGGRSGHGGRVCGVELYMYVSVYMCNVCKISTMAFNLLPLVYSIPQPPGGGSKIVWIYRMYEMYVHTYVDLNLEYIHPSRQVSDYMCVDNPIPNKYVCVSLLINLCTYIT